MDAHQYISNRKRATQSSGPAMSRYLPEQPGLGMFARFAPGVHRFLHKRLIRLAYDLVSLSAKDATVDFMNYGFSSTRPDDPDLVLDLESRKLHSIQLYFRVASAISLTGLDVLEVGCGRGGGASFVMSQFEPLSVTGLDFSRAAVAFCTGRYAQKGLSFRQGDAEQLPYAAESFDAVLNIESSHCYSSMERFLAEVVRVLRPGGYFLFADFRDVDQVDTLRTQLLAAGLTIRDEERITPNVLRALEIDSDFKILDIQKTGKHIRPLLEQTTAVKGSPIYEAFRTGACEYMRFVLRKETRTMAT